MNLFILAAGRGQRLYPLTKDTPKPLLDIGDGETLLGNQLAGALNSSVIDRVFVITGYLTEKVEAWVEPLGDRVEVIYNPFFDISNNIVTLWCAQHLLQGEDFIVTNGDNFYKIPVYDHICAGSPDEVIQLTVSFPGEFDDDDMKVTLNEAGHSVRISKTIPIPEANAESVGLVLVKGPRSRRLFWESLQKLIRMEEKRNHFFLEICNDLAAQGEPITCKELRNEHWREMDFHPDLDQMRKLILGQ
jgi:choline kinase